MTPEKCLKGKTFAVIMAVSREEGLEYYEIYEKSVDVDAFMEFLMCLRLRLIGQKVALFLDNLSVHHSKKVKSFCDKKDLPLIFNLAYSPEYNPIENVFSLVKNRYKRDKHQSMVKHDHFDALKLVKKSIEDLNDETVKRICRAGMKKLIDLSS